MGKGGRGKSEDSRQAPTREAKDAVDRRQNSKISRTWGPRHLTAVSTAMRTKVANKDSVRKATVET